MPLPKMATRHNSTQTVAKEVNKFLGVTYFIEAVPKKRPSKKARPPILK